MGYADWAILVRAEELQRLGKTGEYDETVVLDRPDLPWFLACLLWLLRGLHTRQKVQEFRYIYFRDEFANAAVELGHSRPSPCQYAIRHGASDRVANRRSLVEI